jgi:hypothetical protein
MPGVFHANVFDQGLNYLEANATRLVLCSAEPTTFTEADTTFKLAEVTVSGADYTVAAGDTAGGRKVTQAAKTVTGTATGTATHYAILNVAGSLLLARNTMTNVAITNAEPQDVNAVRVLEILQPTA